MSSSRDKRVGKKYRLIKRLGKGSFGDVYAAEDVTNGEEAAVKLEKARSKHPQLSYESKVYRALQGIEGVPSLKWYGTEGSYNVLVTDRLGKSMEDLFRSNEGRNSTFDAATTLYIGFQMIKRIRDMHNAHFIHRDIKPDNFMSGYKNGQITTKVYVIDFGLSKRYRHPKTRKHIPYREGKNLTGTPRYASINNHLGVEQSRRDDMESIGYVLVYFAKGILPWQGLKANTKKQKYKKIMEKKIDVPIESLCQGVPSVLRDFISLSRNLKYEDTPQYERYLTMFEDYVNSRFDMTLTGKTGYEMIQPSWGVPETSFEEEHFAAGYAGQSLKPQASRSDRNANPYSPGHTSGARNHRSRHRDPARATSPFAPEAHRDDGRYYDEMNYRYNDRA